MIMKRIIALLTALVLIIAFAGCASGNKGSQSEAETKAAETTKSAASSNASEASKTSDETTAKNNDDAKSGKTLVVYFSATGTTKGMAEQIAGATGADTYEIKAAQPYTSDDLNYNDSPEIGSEKINLDSYTNIFIGFPIWWGEEPRIMDTFVESYDFSGKTMIPFCTSGGSGIGSSGDNLKANAGSGNWLEGARLSSSSDIKGWIDGLKLAN